MQAKKRKLAVEQVRDCQDEYASVLNGRGFAWAGDLASSNSNGETSTAVVLLCVCVCARACVRECVLVCVSQRHYDTSSFVN